MLEGALEVAVEAARAGGRVLAEGLHGGHEVRLKDSRTNLVTWADVHSQAAVAAIIQQRFPSHAIIGEEGTIGDPAAEFAWYVDPLDGTTNFAHGLPFFCVSLALRGPVGTQCGVIYDPYHDELFTAERGGGATCNGRPLRTSATQRLAQALVVAQIQTDDRALIHDFAEMIERLLNAARSVRYPGAPALVLCYIAAGRLDAYCERHMDPWDIVAGQLILEEAGGRVTDFDGRPLEAELADVVASNGPIHDELLPVLGRSTAA
jgi:myo-inositol-1(or 4)-monophosphatase